MSQKRNKRAIAINTWDRNLSSWYCCVPGACRSAKEEIPIEEEGHYEQNILQELRELSLHFWRYCSSTTPVVESGKYSKRKGTNAKVKLEPPTISKPKAWHKAILGFRLCALAWRAGWQLISWILLVSRASSIERNHLISGNGCLAHRAGLIVWPCLQPLVKAGPAEKMPTHGDDSILGCIQADITFKVGIIWSLLLPALCTT